MIESESFELIVYTNAVAHKFTHTYALTHTHTLRVREGDCVYLFFDIILSLVGGWIGGGLYELDNR